MYEYDDAGRVVRSVTTREAEWTEQDRAELLALAVYRAGLCPCGCGHRYADTTSPEATGPRFVASRVTCRARLTLLETQAAVTTENSRHTGARLWRIEKR